MQKLLNIHFLMHISWLGNSCFKIHTKDAVIITDLYDSLNGLKTPRIGVANILTFSSTDFALNKGPKEAFTITGAGEYEINGVFVYGHQINDTIIYIFNVEGIQIVHLGNLANSDIPTTALDLMEKADIFMIPVGGHGTLDAKQASKLVHGIEPRVVLPMTYNTKGVTSKLDPIDAFLKEIGAKDIDELDKLKITAKDLPQDTTQTVILTRV